ncbi:MAG: Cof-type HAD-IIB family hydrolase [Coprobacillus sp.]
MMKELLCFDVDGTLRDNVHHQVSQSTLKALKLLKEKGYRCIISSGRGIDSLSQTGLMEIFDWDGYVCNNGQIVLDRDGKELFHATMDKKAVAQVIETAHQLGYATVVKSQPRFITKAPDEFVLESQRYFKNVIPHIGEYQGQDVDALIVYGPHLYDYAPFQLIEGVQVLPGESTYADITIASLSKATGISQLLDLYQLKEYIAFGDSMNDVEMFKHAKTSIAMGQGNKYLKSIATHITDSIDNDGIYKACLYLGMIEEELSYE